MSMVLSFPVEVAAEERTARERRKPGGALRGLFFAVAIESVAGLLGWTAWTAIHALLR